MRSLELCFIFLASSTKLHLYYIIGTVPTSCVNVQECARLTYFYCYSSSIVYVYVFVRAPRFFNFEILVSLILALTIIIYKSKVLAVATDFVFLTTGHRITLAKILYRDCLNEVT